MSNWQSIWRFVSCNTLGLVVGFTLLPRAMYGQPTESQSELESSIARLKPGDLGPRDIVVLADAGVVQAIPVLEAQFGRATDLDTKAQIASGLVKLKDRDDTYWNFLLEQATLAVDSNVPDDAFSESQGKTMSPGTPELQEWAHTHNVSLEKAAEHARYDIPGEVLLLGQTGDPRGVPLLRRALQAHNHLMVAMAAKGLALIQDKESIPLIIAAAHRAPEGYNSLIAESLVYFDDPQAQSAVDTYMSKEKAKIAREARAQGRGAFGW
jgi:hypothetical protein